jgi:hypothetical protein
MDIDKRINEFLELDYKKQLDSWQELLSIGEDFLKTNNQEKELAEKIAATIFYHRSLMGSSKTYESAFEIDTGLLSVSIPIARIAYEQSKPLVEYLKSGIYYSDVLPLIFNKEKLVKEINEIENIINNKDSDKV